MTIQEFLKSREFPGKLLAAKVWGSRSHNTHKDDSDWDFLGVYVAPTREILGMNKVPDTIQNESKPDYAFYEVRKFCDLLLVGNPGILETLYTDRMHVTSDDWETLRSKADSFLSKKAVLQYVGYSEGQLKRLRSGTCLRTKGCDYNEKWAYHLIRLLIDAMRIVRGSPPVVWKEGSERQLLMRIRGGEVSREEVEKDADERIRYIREALESCALPEVGDGKFLNDWLVSLRLKDVCSNKN